MARLALLLLVALVACTPAAEPVFDRDGGDVLIEVVAHQTLYGATLSVVNASTDDDRCIQLGGTDLGCTLGDIPEGTTATVETQSPGSLSCVLFAYLEPGNAVTYRPFPCVARR